MTRSGDCNFTSHCLKNQRKLEGQNAAFDSPPLWFCASLAATRAEAFQSRGVGEKQRDTAAECWRGQDYATDRRRKASGTFCRLAVALRESHTVGAAGKPPTPTPPTFPSMHILISRPHFSRALFEGSLGTCSVCRSTSPSPARYFWPSAARLALGLGQSQRGLGPVTGPQVLQERRCNKAEIKTLSLLSGS